VASGCLIVRVIAGKSLDSSDWVGNLNSYVMLRINKQLHATASVEGLAPTWEETFTFDVNSATQTLEVSLYDKDGQCSELVGQANLEIESFTRTFRDDEHFVSLKALNGMPAGNIQCFVKFQPNRGINHASAAHWLRNNTSWTSNEPGWCSNSYCDTGANGPATNLLDGDLGTYWNAGASSSDEWVTFDLGEVHELSKFQICANARPEAPRECELQAASSLSGPWRSLVEFHAPWNQEGWRDAVEFNSFAAQFWRLVVYSVHSSNPRHGACINQVAFFGYPVALDADRPRTISEYSEQLLAGEQQQQADHATTRHQAAVAPAPYISPLRGNLPDTDPAGRACHEGMPQMHTFSPDPSIQFQFKSSINPAKHISDYEYDARFQPTEGQEDVLAAVEAEMLERRARQQTLRMQPWK